MGSNEMEFHCGNKNIEMYLDDDGMFRIIQTFTDKEGIITIAALAEKKDAVHVFHEHCYRIEHEWELAI